MKKRVARIETEKLSISLPNAMAEWLRRDAECRLTTVSAIIKDVLMPQFKSDSECEKRHPPRKSKSGSSSSDCAMSAGRMAGAKRGGSVKSTAKAAAVRKNGKRGGRPKRQK